MNWKFCVAFLLVVIIIVPTFGEIGWCGNIWPLDEADITAGEDLEVYFQIWKEGVTDSSASAPGEDLSATLYYRVSGGLHWNTITMEYNVDVGNNDEYMGVIPSSGLSPRMSIEVYCEAYDSTDGTTCQGNDQEGNPATEDDPLVYQIISPTSMDVMVYFSVDMNGVDSLVEPVSVVGTFTGWDDSPVACEDTDSDGIYECSVLIPEGSPKHQEYKYIMGSTPYIWEEIANRSFQVNDTGDGEQYLPTDYWNNRTTRPISVVFRVDMSGQIVTDPYIAGNQPPLHWGWDDGWTEHDRIYDDGTHCDETAEDSIYTTIIEFPTGTYREVEYKFTTDGTDNEPLPPFQNHRFTLTQDEDTLWLPVVTFGVLEDKVKSVPLPQDIIIVDSSPNPFNDATEIKVVIYQQLKTPATLTVYNLDGKLIRKLSDELKEPGTYNFIWNGEDNQNNPVPSGTYIYRLKSGDYTLSGKMTLLK
ncbi:hypothetical protein DRQ33_05565 [bacterium]|nr:MAG: hypothetical protein DRQ33_05565 [bacterium]